MKFGFVAKHRGTWPVKWLTEALGVSRTGFYAWEARPQSARSRTDAVIGAAVRASFVMSDRTYGARRVLPDVRAAGHACGLHRIERLMRAQALRARPRRRALPLDLGVRSVHALAPNILDREFTATAPNQKWVADFTYVWTHEGWLFVAVVLDLYARRVVGWSMHATMTTQLVTAALTMAVWRRAPRATLLHHSDQGSQHERALPAFAARSRCHLQHESVGERLGQLGDGELLLDAEDRTGRPEDLPNTRRGTHRYLRLHRALLQPDQAAFHTGQSESRRLRTKSTCSLGPCLRNRSQSQS